MQVRALVRPEKSDGTHQLQEVGVDMAAKGIVWLKVRPDYEPLFSILDGLRLYSERRYWIEHRDTEGNLSDVEVDL